MSQMGHNSVGVQLRRHVERIERLEEEIKSLNDDKKELYAAAKSQGFDTKVLKQVISARRKDPDARAEEDALFDTYWRALHRSATQHDEPEVVPPPHDPETGEVTEQPIDEALQQKDSDAVEIPEFLRREKKSA